MRHWLGAFQMCLGFGSLRVWSDGEWSGRSGEDYGQWAWRLFMRGMSAKACYNLYLLVVCQV
jgi:hypothetical protein